MIALVREWLLGITAAAILAALAEHMMPAGGVKQVGKLVCGLMLVAAVLRPLGSVDVTGFAMPTAYDTQYIQALKADSDSRMKTIIEEELSAYSTDKAAQMGVPCRIRVVCALGEEGVFLPVSARLTGTAAQTQWDQIAQFLQTELGLDSAALTFSGEEQT